MTIMMIAMVMHRYTWFLGSKYMWSRIPKSGMEREIWRGMQNMHTGNVVMYQATASETGVEVRRVRPPVL
jgi:hypothetical protein